MLEGELKYGTAFGEHSGAASAVDDCSRVLLRHGFNYLGKVRPPPPTPITPSPHAHHLPPPPSYAPPSPS